MAAVQRTTNPFGGANWQYIACQRPENSDDSPLIPETWTKTSATSRSASSVR